MANTRWASVLTIAGELYCGECAGDLMPESALTNREHLQRAQYILVWCPNTNCAQHGVKMQLPIKRTSLPVYE